jgi:FixJ family two-component response regulator
MGKLTDKELQVFKKIYFRCLTQQDTAFELCISQQCVIQYLTNIDKKWETQKRVSS